MVARNLTAYFFGRALFESDKVIWPDSLGWLGPWTLMFAWPLKFDQIQYAKHSLRNSMCLQPQHEFVLQQQCASCCKSCKSCRILNISCGTKTMMHLVLENPFDLPISGTGRLSTPISRPPFHLHPPPPKFSRHKCTRAVHTLRQWWM